MYHSFAILNIVYEITFLSKNNPFSVLFRDDDRFSGHPHLQPSSVYFQSGRTEKAEPDEAGRAAGPGQHEQTCREGRALTPTTSNSAPEAKRSFFG